MSVHISFIQRTPFRQRAWKTLNVVVGVTTILNVSMVGTLIAPRAVSAHESNTNSSDTVTTGSPAPVANPPLGQSCGLDIGLIVDTSGSVDSTELGQMKTALKSFADAFTGTPTEFSLSKFDTQSTLVQSFTGSIPTVDTKIDSLATTNGNTNWDSGLNRSFDSFDNGHLHRASKQDLIVIATDGSPNRYGYPTANSTFDWTAGLQHGITTANTIKTFGTRIVVVGIGEDTSDPATPAQKLDKMKSISGTTVAATPAAITVGTDVIKVTNFTGIGTALAAYAQQLCGGKILIQKQLDTNGDDQADVTTTDPLLSGWTFDINGTASNPAPQTTANSGSLQFDNVLSGSGYSVVETPKDGTHLVSATCLNGDQSVGSVDLANGKVSGLTMGTDDTISCTFVNGYATGSLRLTKVVDSGSASASDFAFTIWPDPNGLGTIHPTAGSTGTYTFTDVPIGSYTVSESAGPDPYHQVSNTCTHVSVTANRTATCSVHNARDTGRLKVIKHVVGGQASASDWSLHVKHSGSDIASSPQAGSETGTTYTVPTGSYTISETGGPSGYSAAFSADCSEGRITVTVDHTADCTVTNTRDTGRINFVKVVSNESHPDLKKFDFNVHGGTYHSGDSVSLTTGQYDLSEDSTNGYVFVSASGACSGTNPSQLTLTAASQGGTCTITNRRLFPDLTVTKTDGLTVATPGQTLTYTMIVANVGDLPADNATVVDTLPAHLTYLSSTVDGVSASPLIASNVLTWNLGSMAVAGPTSTHTITVTVKLDTLFPNGTTSIVNGVTVSTTSTEANLDNNVASDTDTVTAGPVIAVTKTAPATVAAGQNIAYTITWSISGNASATNVIVTDATPANTTFVASTCGTATGTCTMAAAAGTVSWNLGSRHPGDSGTVTMTVKSAMPIANGTIITNTSTFDTAENTPVTGTATTTVQSGPSLTITKTNDVVGFTNPGKQVTYTVTVVNAATASDTAHGVILTDVLPSGFTYTVGGGSTKNFTLGDIAPGASVVTSYAAVVSATQTAGTYTNTASAQGTNAPKVSASSDVEIRVPVILGATVAPDVTIIKTVTTKVTAPGKIVTYTVTITNPGQVDLTGVSLTDKLPKGFTFVDSGKGTKTWTIGTLRANRQRVIDYQVLIGASVPAGTYQNAATVISKELDPKTAKASVTVKVPKVLGLATTGVSMRDYILFGFGLSLMGLGTTWVGRLRRQPKLDRQIDAITYS